MKKMIKHHRGRASLKERQAEELGSLETPDEEGEWCWTKKSRVTRWGRRMITFHYFAEDDEGEQAPGGLNHLVSRNAGGAQWTWKKDTVVVDSGAAENVMPSCMFPEMGRFKNGKWFKGPWSENIKKCGQQVMSVRT